MSARTDKKLVMYGRLRSCPFINTAKRVLHDLDVPYEELHIDQDDDAYQKVVDWTGFASVPTMVVAANDSLLPITEPDHLEQGASPRGIDRGSMITEASDAQLRGWLKKHGFVD